MGRLRGRQEWQFFTVLYRAGRSLGALWWAVLLARGVLPAVFAIATGVLVAAVQAGRGLTGPLVFTGVVFVALQVLSPVHTAVSANLGDRVAAGFSAIGVSCGFSRSSITLTVLLPAFET